MTSPNILERVRKLLAQANGEGVTPEEAEAFAGKAAALMARHGIEQSLVDAQRDPADDPMATKRLDLDNPYAHERGLLLSRIGEPLSVAVYWGRHRATLIGRRSDVDRVEQLYTTLLLYVAPALTRPVDTSWCWDRAEASHATRAYRKAWLIGFGRSIGRRLAAVHREVVEAGEPGSALVLADRLTVAQAHAKELFPKAGVHKQRRITDGGAYSAGVAAGELADIGLDRIGGSRTAIGGAR